MKQVWFKRSGWFYLPISAPGTLVCLAATGFCVNVFLAIDRRSHSVSDTLYGVRVSVFRLHILAGGLDRAEYQSTVAPPGVSSPSSLKLSR